MQLCIKYNSYIHVSCTRVSKACMPSRAKRPRCIHLLSHKIIWSQQQGCRSPWRSQQTKSNENGAVPITRYYKPAKSRVVIAILEVQYRTQKLLLYRLLPSIDEWHAYQKSSTPPPPHCPLCGYERSWSLCRVISTTDANNSLQYFPILLLPPPHIHSNSQERTHTHPPSKI